MLMTGARRADADAHARHSARPQVMLMANDPYAIRLIDFGLAINVRQLPDGQMDPTDNKWDCAGTQAYRAPEVGAGTYEPAKVDIWAMGITLFSLVAGFFPVKEAVSRRAHALRTHTRTHEL